MTETNLNTYATRYEESWKYFLNPGTYAFKLKISMDTEKKDQATSWGALQIMGSVARELGYTDYLVKLIDPNLSLDLSGLKIKQLQSKFTEMRNVISAYNMGNPKKTGDGRYYNQIYVDKVLKNLALAPF